METPGVLGNEVGKDKGDEFQTNFEKITAGDLIRATFSPDYNPRGMGGLISRAFGRPHIVIDHSQSVENIIPGIQYSTQVLKVKENVIIVSHLIPTEYGEIQAKIKESGGKFITNVDAPNKVLSKERLAELISDIKTFGDIPEGTPESYIKAFPEAFSFGDLPLKDVVSIWLDPEGVIEQYAKGVQKKSGLNQPTASPQHKSFESKERALSPEPIDWIDDEHIRFFDMLVTTPKPRNGEHVELPPGFTLDAKNAVVLRKIAAAYERRAPLFIEGGTTVSKTSSVEVFSEAIGASLRKFNFSGQTDTSELIGKYVPNDESVKLEFERLIEGWSSPDNVMREACYRRLANKESVELLKKAFVDANNLNSGSTNEIIETLNLQQRKKIAMAEGITISDANWRLQLGALPLAMIRGDILLLDEMTLGLAQVIERINPALEINPSLTLDELGGLKIGKGGQYEVHKNFWIVAAGNTAGTEGRNVVSDPLKRRFREWQYAEGPTADDYESMIKQNISGERPRIKVGNDLYKGENVSNPPYEELSNMMPEIDLLKFVNTLARFHEAVEKISRADDPKIGKEREQNGGKYTFTRVTLLNVLDYICNSNQLDVQATIQTGRPVRASSTEVVKEALKMNYLDPMPKSDHQAVIDQWQSIALGSLQSLMRR